MGFHFEDMKEGRIDGITIREMKLNGNVIWPSQAYTYNLYNIRVRVYGDESADVIINAGGTNRLYVLADVDVRNGTTTVKTITDIRLTPISSPVPEIILSDKPFITAESRGEIEGPAIYGMQVVCEAYGHTTTVQVAQEANELLARLVDMSPASITLPTTEIDASEVQLPISYVANGRVSLQYTAGTFDKGVQPVDSDLYVRYGDQYQTYVVMGEGSIMITVPANRSTDERTVTLYIQDYESREQSRTYELRQRAMGVALMLNVEIDQYTGIVYAYLTQNIGEPPTTPVTLRIGSISLTPSRGGAERTYSLGGTYNVRVGERIAVGTVPLASGTAVENGYAIFFGCEVVGYGLEYRRRYYYLQPQAIWTFEIDESTLKAANNGVFAARGFSMYFYADCKIYKNGVLETTQSLYFDPAVPSGTHYVEFALDVDMLIYVPVIKSSSRMDVIGPSESLNIHLTTDRIPSWSYDYPVTVQENEVTLTYDTDSLVFDVLPDGIVPGSGGVVNVRVSNILNVTRRYTSTYEKTTAEAVNMQLGPETSIERIHPSSSESIEQVYFLPNFLEETEYDVNVAVWDEERQAYYSKGTKYDAYRQEERTSERGLLAVMSTVLADAALDPEKGLVVMVPEVVVQGTSPTTDVHINGAVIHMQPDEGTERQIVLGDIVAPLNAYYDCGYVPLPEQEEKGMIWVTGTVVEDWDVIIGQFAAVPYTLPARPSQTP